MVKKKKLLTFIVPVFVAVAGVAVANSSWIFGIGEPKLPKKFD